MILAKVCIFTCLALGFTGFYYQMRKSGIIRKKLQEAYGALDVSAMQRAREHKKTLELAMHESQAGIIVRLEHRFLYSGLGRIFPFLTPEFWIVMLIVSGAAVYFVSLLFSGSWVMGGITMLVYLLAILIIESLLIQKNYRAVEENLLEFLNLLGNYSITAGEVTGILSQVSRFLNEPLKSALEECYYEAQTSGDASLALLAMADKIEHPQFKELIRNIEICSRYSADFVMVVSNSRRAVRDYMRSRQERKSLAMESLVNMFVLFLMLIIVLIVVDQIIETSIWTILFQTLIGQVCVGITVVILIAFYIQVSAADK